MLMAAPGTIAPVLSVMVPTTVAVPVVCEKAAETSARKTTKNLDIAPNSQRCRIEGRHKARLQWRIRVMGHPRQAGPSSPQIPSGKNIVDYIPFDIGEAE